MKAFQLVQTIGSVAVIGIMALVWGLPAAPAVLFYEWASDAFGSSTAWLDAVWTGLTLSSTAIVYMLLLIFFSALIQFVLHVRIKEHTVVRLHSMTTIRWAICGQIGRSTRPVLQHLVPSFVANAYFRICGAKIQIGAQINSALLNDPNLLTIESDVVIGGGAIINGHLVERGELIFSPILIEKGALIGTGAMIQPGVQIGPDAVIASQAVVPKYKVIPAGEVWGGIPARKIKDSSER
jgi:serine acetyltransferase